ncbi:acyltransferase family protein [Citrobacter portucalensis]|uniref:acyltransferase family protein n=1 Tax=Citrobacter portucalensis TaxID=1639133 RepID=UPI0018A4D18A|nr:acyltransferase [Citrobacter portucalensis]BBV40660.1 acyltransferase [Citrobacter portucalensis]BBV45599.1 acyltransferase [Citrobacter portucalensis]BBW11658.1 acyltransferase [Citrobacter portucalensis]BBW41273.1 acyltransferase [Citrobacter portucalensis]
MLRHLTGLRFIAALMVYLCHLNTDYFGPFIKEMFSQGFIGVSFFFILSGFILSYSYEDKLKNKVTSKKQFILLRLARIVPMHLLLAIPFILLAIHSKNFDFTKTLTNLLLIQSWIPKEDYYFSLNGVSWSLSDELFFYVMFIPLIYTSVAKRISIAITIIALLLIMNNFKIIQAEEINHWLYYIFPVSRLVEFIFGMAIYSYWKNKQQSTSGSLLFAVALTPLLIAVYYSEGINNNLRYSLYYLFPMAIFFTSCIYLKNGVIHAILSSKALDLLGKSSFVFYLIHQPFILFCFKLFGHNPGPIYLITLLIIISMVSIILYKLVEEPLEMMLRKRILAVK